MSLFFSKIIFLKCIFVQSGFGRKLVNRHLKGYSLAKMRFAAASETFGDNAFFSKIILLQCILFQANLAAN